MSNYIKIPLLSNPARSFLSSAIVVGTQGSTPGYTGGGTRVAGTTVASGVTTTSGTGTGAEFGVVLTGGTFSLTITASNTGEGYKVGDTVTLTAKAAATGVTSFSEAIVFAITSAMLVSIEGNSVSDKFQLIPTDDIASVSRITNSSGASFTADQIFVSTVNTTGDATNAVSEIAGYTIQFDDAPTAANDMIDCIATLSASIAKAESAVNSQPEVVWFAGYEVLSISYGKNPSV